MAKKFYALLLMIFCLSAIGLSQQSVPKGYVSPVSLTGVDPNGVFRFIKLDSSGNVVTAGSGGSPGNSVSGYVQTYAPVALNPNGSWGYLNLDSSGNLKTTGVGGSSFPVTTTVHVSSGGAINWDSGSTLNLALGSTFTSAVSLSALSFTATSTLLPWAALTERANNITPASGFDFLDQDSTAHGIVYSPNGRAIAGLASGISCGSSQSCASPAAQPVVVLSGYFTFSSTAQAVTGLGTYCKTALLSAWASSQSHAYVYEISSITTAGFTITTTSNTDVWNWGAVCY